MDYSQKVGAPVVIAAVFDLGFVIWMMMDTTRTSAATLIVLVLFIAVSGLRFLLALYRLFT
jgi:hypothetical protein